MNDLLQRLHTEHRQLELLLDYLEGNVADLAVDDQPDWDDLALALDLLRPLLSGRHYQEEDRLWAQLTARPDGPRLTLEALRLQHRQAAVHASDLEDAVYAARLGRVPPPERLRDLTRDLVATLRRQIALEERALFPLARALLAATAAPAHTDLAAQG
jgi:hemerythrin-like domain-containing protein